MEGIKNLTSRFFTVVSWGILVAWFVPGEVAPMITFVIVVIFVTVVLNQIPDNSTEAEKLEQSHCWNPFAVAFRLLRWACVGWR